MAVSSDEREGTSRVTPRPYIYARKSRDDSEQDRAAFGRQLATARDLATAHGLDVPAECIIVEAGGGGRLRTRPGLVRLLDLCRAGLCTHIITAFDDRIDRLEDKREQADLEDALYSNAVTIISRDGVRRYDEDLDVLPAEVRALVARHELRVFRKRRREHNRQRLARNERAGGRPPWGYVRDVSAPGSHRPVYPAYTHLCELLRRVVDGESLYAVRRDWAERGIPAPGGGAWTYHALWYTVHNPFYAGFVGRISRPARGRGYIHLNPDEYEVTAGEEGAWEHPLTWEEYQRIRERFRAYRARYQPRESLLAGLLRCPAGRGMTGQGVTYGCDCPTPRHHTSRAAWDGFALRLLAEFLTRVPPRLLDVPVHPPRERPVAALAAARRELARCEEDARSLATDADRQRRLLGDALYETVLTRARGEWEAARARVLALEEDVSAPDVQEAVTLLEAMRDVDLPSLSIEVQRRLLRSAVRSLTLQPAPRLARMRRAVVDWQGWVIEEGLGFAVPEALWPPKRAASSVR